jgi:hypothetical protein
MNLQQKIIAWLMALMILLWILALSLEGSRAGNVFLGLAGLTSTILSFYGGYLFYTSLFDMVIYNSQRKDYLAQEIQVNLNHTHTHSHYVYDGRSSFVEGIERTETKVDGTSTTVRHIKKWN